MNKKTNFLAACKLFTSARSGMMWFCLSVFIFPWQLNGQETLPLPLTHSVITDIGSVTALNPGAVQENLSITYDGGNPLPVWLDFSTAHDPDNNLIITFKHVPGQCVPIPPAQTDCAGTPCAAVPGYSTAAKRECHTLEVTAFSSTITHYLCVFGDAAMVINPATVSVKAALGDVKDIALTNGRPDENYIWKIDPLPGPSYLTWPDNTGKDAKLRFTAPTSALAPTSHNIRVEQTTVPTCHPGTSMVTVETVNDNIFAAGPVDIVFVVDVSGSMGIMAQCACSGDPGCPNPSNTTKLKYLKDQIGSVFEQMKGLAQSTDRIGLVSFHTTPKVESGLKDFSSSDFLSKVASWADDGYNLTAIGLGLEEGVKMLKGSNPNSKKYIILLTNGMQNVTPYLEWTDNSESMVKVAASSGTIIFNTDLGIKVLPIAIFTPNADYKKKLEKLGTGTGANVIGDVCESGLSLLSVYTDAAKAIGSPKLVTFERKVFTGTSATGTFRIEENLDNLLVNFINVGNQNFNDLKIEKQVNNVWENITGLGKIQPLLNQASIKRLFSIDFPKILNGSPLNSSGDYRYTLQSTLPNIPYEFSVLIDDRGIKHHIYTGDVRYQAGDPLHLMTSIYYNNLPVTDARVTVSLDKPTASFGKGLAKEKIPGQYVNVEKVALTEKGNDISIPIPGTPGPDTRANLAVSGKRVGFPLGVPYIKRYTIQHPAITSAKGDGERMSDGDKKYQVLLAENDFGDIFQTSPNAVPLQHVGNGIYQGKFTDTKNMGLYNLHFHLAGTLNPIGKYERLDEKSVMVNFGKPSLSKSSVQLMWETPLVISMRPQDDHGNLLGPGNAEQIDMYVSKGTVSAPYDYLDGRYIVQLYGITDKDDPNIIIRIAKDVLFNGKLSDIRRRKCFVALQGGYSIPQAKFDSLHNPGFLAELKLGCRFTRKFGGQISGGYYSFKNQATNKNLPIYGGALGLFYLFPLTPSQGWNLHAEVNGGYYKPESASGAFGFNGGLGISSIISPCLSLTLEGKYHHLYTDPQKIDFISTALGIKIHF